MKFAQKNWAILSSVFFAVFLGLFMLTVFISQYVAKEIFFSKYSQFEADIIKHEKLILADLKLLDSKPIFTEEKYSKDAQEFLSQHISWSGQPFEPLNTPAHQLIQKYKDNIFKTNDLKNLNFLMSQNDLMSLDLTWLEETLKYDHWNIRSNSYSKEKIKLATSSGSLQQIGIMSTLPIPDTNELRQFTIIYFLQQYKKGNTQQGLKVLEHVAQLLHTSNNLVFNMAAIALLNSEISLKENLKFSNPVLTTKDRILAYKRLSWAWIQISQLPWINKSLNVFEPYLKKQNAACSALDDGMNLNYMKDFFEPRLIFEIDMRSNFKNWRKFQRNLTSICQSEYLEIYDQAKSSVRSPFLVRSPASPFNLNDQIQDDSIYVDWSKVPYIRRLMGSLLFSIAMPNWLKQYDDLTEK